MVAPLRQRGHHWLRNRGWAGVSVTRTARQQSRGRGSTYRRPKQRHTALQLGHGPTCAGNTFFAIVRYAPPAETTTKSLKAPVVVKSISSPAPGSAMAP